MKVAINISILFFIISTNVFSNTNNLKSTVIDSIQSAHTHSMKMVGGPSDMQLRADIFYDLYFNNPKFLFGLSTSHLTLAINRFSVSGQMLKENSKIFRKRKLTSDMILWGKKLNEINQKMTQLLIFSKELHEISQKFQITSNDLLSMSYQQVFASDVNEVLELLPLWQKLNETDHETENELLLESIAHKFIHWEHFTVIQPRLERAKYSVGRGLRYFLKHVAGRRFERKILLPYGVRTTINLNCFKEPRYIHTKNFLNPFEREKRAIEFLNELKKIDYDPTGSCFDDDYYELGS